MECAPCGSSSKAAEATAAAAAAAAAAAKQTEHVWALDDAVDPGCSTEHCVDAENVESGLVGCYKLINAAAAVSS